MPDDNGAAFDSHSDLFMSEPEVQQVTAEAGRDLSADDLWSETLGWRKGVEAALREHDPKAARRLMDAQLAQLPPPVLDVLLPLATEDVWHPARTPALVDGLSDGWWQTVQATPLPVRRAKDGSLHVPAALGDALADALAARSPARSRALHRRAAARPGLAPQRHVWHLWYAGQPEEAARVLEEAMLERLRSDDEAGGLSLRRLAPEGVQSLRLRVITAWTRFVVDHDAELGREAERLMFEAYASGNRDPLLLVYMATAEMHAGRFARMREFAEEGLRLHPHAPERLRLLRWHALALGRTGDLVGQVRVGRQLTGEAEAAGDILMAAYGASMVAAALNTMEDYPRAEVAFVKALDLWRVVGQASGQAEVANNYASLLVDIGHPDEALRVVEQALALGGLPERWHRFLENARAYTLHMYGRHEEALMALRASLGTLRASRLTAYEYRTTVWASERQALDGDSEGARELVRRAGQLNGAHGLGEDTAQTFSTAVVAYAANEQERAREGFQAASRADDLYIWDQGRAYAYLTALGEDHAEALHRVLNKLGHAGPLLTDGRLLLPRLAPLGEHPLLGRWVAPLLRASEVRVSLFGAFRLRTDDRDVPISLRKSRELLAYLLLHGPATRSELLTALWPDVSSASVEYFKQAVKRLREDLVPLAEGGKGVKVVAGRYHLPDNLKWTAGLDLRPVFPTTLLHAGGEPEVGVFLAPFDSGWVEDMRPAAHALLAERIVGMDTGGSEEDLQRLRLLHHLLPDDTRVMTALVRTLRRAGLEAEARATRAAHHAAMQALGN